APALSAAALSGPPDATGPEVSRSVLTALSDRSTVRNCPSYQPDWASAFRCCRLMPGPICSVVLIRGIPPVTGSAGPRGGGGLPCAGGAPGEATAMVAAANATSSDRWLKPIFLT